MKGLHTATLILAVSAADVLVKSSVPAPAPPAVNDVNVIVPTGTEPRDHITMSPDVDAFPSVMVSAADPLNVPAPTLLGTSGVIVTAPVPELTVTPPPAII